MEVPLCFGQKLKAIGGLTGGWTLTARWDDPQPHPSGGAVHNGWEWLGDATGTGRVP